jgi:translation initiation factor IF-2
MSRVRIYELAKEAGMASKDLADKLIEQGYDIKGHSSTVDDETAEKIRKTVLQSSTTERVEKRIDDPSGATVIRRRSTIIRRRAAEHPEDADQDQDTAAETEVEHVTETVAEVKQDEEAEASSTETAEPAEIIVKAEPIAEEKEADEADQVKSVAEDDSSVDTPVKAEGETVEVEKDTDAAEADDVPEKSSVEVKAKKKTVKKEKKVVSKKLARVVGTIDIPIEEEKTIPVRPKRKPARSGAGAPPFEPGSPGESDAATEAARARKKGKKGVAEPEDDEFGRKGAKGAKKGKKSVKYTHFGNDYQRTAGRRGKKGGRGRKDGKPIAPPLEMKASKKRIKVFDTITVGDLAAKMRVKANEVIAKLMGLGVMATMNQSVDVETAMLIATDFGYEVEQGVTEEIGIQMLDQEQEIGETKPRPPVVTVMGHVDHGKTSILDAIRKTDVAEGEAGGITQHIGAYLVQSPAGDVTFVDTPGHAAFTEMRARGAQVTDLVVLVVAADDGVMGQTREAIHHAQAADVPIIVAVNKIDKDNADPDRVKRELAELELTPEEWGGQTIYCETSAKKNIGIENLLENIQLMAEILELKANPDRKAKGRVIEARLDKGRGAVATVMVQQGTLRDGDYFVVGQYSGKVRALSDYKGRKIDFAGPSIPVEVQGMSGVPSAGDEFIVVNDEKMAKSVSHSRSLKARESELGANTKISLDKLFEQMSEGDVKELRVVLRADVQGTLEAFAKAAQELSTDEIKVRVLHEGTGTITESDILLASASEAIIIGFNVRPTMKVKDLAQKENVDVRAYDVIYHALDDIRKAMVGMLDPTFEENVIGNAEVRETFGVPKVGTIAGSFVVNGKFKRNAKVRVVRDGVVVYTGKISSLRRFKDDVKEVLAGFECGIGVENFNDIKVGDNLEAFVMEEVEATLD